VEVSEQFQVKTSSGSVVLENLDNDDDDDDDDDYDDVDIDRAWESIRKKYEVFNHR
jgi:hypothetical protein